MVFVRYIFKLIFLLLFSNCNKKVLYIEFFKKIKIYFFMDLFFGILRIGLVFLFLCVLGEKGILNVFFIK